MMKCKETKFEGCMCADCVFNPNYCTNTPRPCMMCDCDLCASGEFECVDLFCWGCSGHTTIEDVNKKLTEVGQGEPWPVPMLAARTAAFLPSER